MGEAKIKFSWTSKKFIFIIGLLLLSASCNVFSTPPQAGVYKTLNGGSDWKTADVLKTGTGSIATTYISKLGFDPSNSQTVYAGSYSSGLYKSEDSAATWTNILSNIEVYDFAVDQQNTKIIYVAGFYGTAGRVVKTTDGGASWNEIYHEGSSLNPVRTVALNPQNPNQVVIGTTSGSFIKSSDGGISWQLVNNFNDQINQVLWQSNVYVLLKDNGLFEYPDISATSTELTKTLRNTFNSGAIDYIDYARSSSSIGTYHQVYADPFTPSLIYLTTDKGLYKSLDTGQTWVLQSLPVQPGKDPVRAIAVARNNSNIVYTSAAGTVYKSLDGGQTWQTQGLVATGFVNFLIVDPQLPQIAYSGIYINSNN
jgi:photosystem II stability/assembly factor-like uncharacterized protein